MARSEPVRICNKQYGTVYRIIRTKAFREDLYWICRDESYYVRKGHKGSLAWISVDRWITGEWEVCYPRHQHQAPSTDREDRE